MTPSNITFIRSDGVEVMRLTRDGIWANPDVAIDDTAKVVVAALDVEIKRLVQEAVAAEKEQQMNRDGWRKCAEGQRTTQFCGLLDAAVKAEREACAKVAEEQADSPALTSIEQYRAKFIADAIRAR